MKTYIDRLREADTEVLKRLQAQALLQIQSAQAEIDSINRVLEERKRKSSHDV